METALMNSTFDPCFGFELLPLPANLVPVATMAQPAPPVIVKNSGSLQRMSELQRFLDQCAEPSYFLNYHQVRSRVIVIRPLPISHLQLLFDLHCAAPSAKHPGYVIRLL